MMTCLQDTRRSQSGLSIVEMMVGVTIALIGIVIMFQLFQTWQERKQTTAAGGDAQIAGSIATYNLARDIARAGYGFGNSSHTGCTVNVGTTITASGTNFPLYPVLITHDSPVAGTDAITVLYGNSDLLTDSKIFKHGGTTAKDFKPTGASGNLGIQLHDLMLVAAVNGGVDTCELVKVKQWVPANGAGISHEDESPVVASWTNDGDIYTLGPAPQRNVWQVAIDAAKHRSLACSEWFGSNSCSSQVGDGIVAVRAQYGIDGANGGTVDGIINGSEWVDTYPTGTPWSRVLAIRIALLARSDQFEKALVTTTAPAWTGGNFTMTNVDGTTDSFGTSGTTDPNNWRNYRYRVYEHVITLRNTLWGNAPS